MDSSSKRCDEEARKKGSAEPKCGFVAICKELSKVFFYIFFVYIYYSNLHRYTSIRALSEIN